MEFNHTNIHFEFDFSEKDRTWASEFIEMWCVYMWVKCSLFFSFFEFRRTDMIEFCPLLFVKIWPSERLRERWDHWNQFGEPLFVRMCSLCNLKKCFFCFLLWAISVLELSCCSFLCKFVLVFLHATLCSESVFSFLFLSHLGYSWLCRQKSCSHQRSSLRRDWKLWCLQRNWKDRCASLLCPCFDLFDNWTFKQ